MARTQGRFIPHIVPIYIFTLFIDHYHIDVQRKIGDPGGARTPNPLLRRQKEPTMPIDVLAPACPKSAIVPPPYEVDSDPDYPQS